tara:strand:- start:260 stop:1030 length:771 start_codon:yes stop_codon:yes gene_type:complete
MPKMTLLEMTQDILSAMESDEVNSITDTGESLQVARVIQRTYYDLITNKEIPEHGTLFKLQGLSNAAFPVIMKVPAAITSIESIRFDARTSATDTDINFTEVPYCTPEEFLHLTNRRDSDSSEILTMSDATYTNGVKLLIRNTNNPTKFTSFDDDHIVFNQYTATINTTLSDNNTQCWGIEEPAFTISDVFVPDMDVDSFPLLFAAAKTVCFADFKQQANQISAGTASLHKSKNQNNKHKVRVANQQHRPNYGRRS